MLGSFGFRCAVMLKCNQPARLVGCTWPNECVVSGARGCGHTSHPRGQPHWGQAMRTWTFLQCTPAVAAAERAAAHCCSHLPAPATRGWPAALYALYCCDNTLAGAKLMSNASRAPHAHVRAWLANIFGLLAASDCGRAPWFRECGARSRPAVLWGLSQAPQHPCPVWHVKLSFVVLLAALTWAAPVRAHGQPAPHAGILLIRAPN